MDSIDDVSDLSNIDVLGSSQSVADDYCTDFIMARLSGCDPEYIALEGNLVFTIDYSISSAGLHVMSSVAHQFSPQGVSFIADLLDGYISIHSWPESGVLDINFFGVHDDLSKLIKSLKGLVRADSFEPMQGDKDQESCLGRQVVGRLDDCGCDALYDPKLLSEILIMSAKDAKFTVAGGNHSLPDIGHEYGVVAYLILSESHFIAKTLPQSKAIFVDCYTCGSEGDPELGFRKFAENVTHGRNNYSVFDR